MATKTFQIQSGANCSQISSNFTKSGGYYVGSASFSPNAGYEFDAPALNGTTYTNYNVLVTRANGTTFNLKTTNYCTFSMNSLGEIMFSLKAAAQIGDDIFNLAWTFQPSLTQTARELTVTQSLQNCVISGLPSAVTDKSELNLTITANANYVFTAAPTLEFSDVVVNPDGNPTRGETFILSQDNMSAALSIDLSEYNLDYLTTVDTITITAAAVSTLHTVSVTTVCDYCITNAPQHISEDSGTVNIIATPQNGYQFETAPSITFYDANGGTVYAASFTVLASKLSANVTFNVANIQNFSSVESIILRAAAAPIQTQIEVNVETEIQNAVLNGLPQTVYSDSVLTLIATANSGYTFNAAPQLLIIDANGNPQIISFTLSDNNTVAQCSVNLGGYDLDENSSITITVTATAVTPYVEKYGTINVYKVTEQNLADFAAVRFKKEKDTPSDTSGYFQLIDLGDYVVSVKRFYCPISDVLTAYIKAGNYNTNIQAETPQNDNFTVDCGTVAVPSVNHSIVDYQTEIKAFLPFVGFVSVPSDYVGKSIALTYRVNIVSGDCVAVLSCNGIEFDFIECSISNDIVFKTNKENNFSGSAEFNLQVIKGLQPYIVVKSFADENKQLYNSDCLRVVLSTISGYFAANEITNFVSDTITETEMQILQSEIANGVELLAV